MYLTSLLVAAGVVGFVTATDPDPTRYSSCWADRGYLSADGLIAGNTLAQNNTFENGTFLKKNGCIYNRHNSTIVSLCNGNGRNRTVNRDEVRRGIDQLIKDCNVDDSGFSGVHVVNNLTFAAYGIYGGKNIKVPPGANPPDVPTKHRKRADGSPFVPAPFKRSRYVPRAMPAAVPMPLQHRQTVDPCATMGYDGVSRYDCAKKPGHIIDANGQCGVPSTENSCANYCEIRRAGFLGLESVPESQSGSQNLPGISAVLAQNTEYTITNGISVGVEGTWEDIIGAAATYEWSTSTTTGKTVQQEAMSLDNIHYWRWVFFPKYIETCGSVTSNTLSPGIPNPNGGQSNPVCSGDLVTTGNVCALTPEIDGTSKQPIAFWAVRYENTDGTPIPIDQQHPSYKTLCTVADPDHDGQQECAIGG